MEIWQSLHHWIGVLFSGVSGAVVLHIALKLYNKLIIQKHPLTDVPTQTPHAQSRGRVIIALILGAIIGSTYYLYAQWILQLRVTAASCTPAPVDPFGKFKGETCIVFNKGKPYEQLLRVKDAATDEVVLERIFDTASQIGWTLSPKYLWQEQKITVNNGASISLPPNYIEKLRAKLP